MTSKPRLENHQPYTIDTLIEVMHALRTPETGCPWDLEQSFETIAPYTIEEAYEVLDAIERGDMQDLREELGDLLLQPIYHAQMASEEGAFTIHDVIHDITHKMITRHPHVFGDVHASSTQEVNAIWEERKASEKGGGQHASILDGVTLGLPSLLRCQKLQKKAAKAGFEWPEAHHVLAKLDEEVNEVKEAIISGDKNHIEEELGDVLLVITDLARKHGINAEEALRKSTIKFERRVRGLESDIHADSKEISDCSLDELKHYWKMQKDKEKRS